MNQKEKIASIAERDRCWTDLRENGRYLITLLEGKNSFTPMDAILLFQCVTVVFADIILFDELVSIDEDMEKDIAKDIESGGIEKIIRELEYWRDILDDSFLNEEKLSAIKKLRKSLWVDLGAKRDEFSDLIMSFPNINLSQMQLMMRCVAMVVLELDLQTIEIELLY